MQGITREGEVQCDEVQRKLMRTILFVVFSSSSSFVVDDGPAWICLINGDGVDDGDNGFDS